MQPHYTAAVQDRSETSRRLDTTGWDPRLREIYEYWLAIHPAEGLPGRRHFDPLKVPKLLPSIWLLDIHRAPLRFKFRLYGTQHVEASAGDHTGKWIDEVYPQFPTSSTYGDYVRIAERGVASYRKGKASYHVPDYKLIERIMLPLATDAVSPDMILGCTIYFR